MTKTVLKSQQPSLYELCRDIFNQYFALVSGAITAAECADGLEALAKKLRAHKPE